MSEPVEPGSAMAVREASGAAIIQAVPIPAQLQELGVRIAEDEGGLRVIILPPNVRQAVNLLTPVSSWTQADPNWSPSVSLVKLEKDAHTYPLPGGKLGLNKQALETLGRLAGVLYTRTSRVPNVELRPDELWAYRATIGFRRSDGTIDEITRERGFSREAETMEIEDSVTKSNKFGPAQSEKWTAEVRKRMIAELRHGPAKTESKAINRALRAGLAMPSSVEARQLEKPFLVIGYNFTPNYDDPEVKRALVAVAMNAQAAIYGGRDVSDEMPQIAAGDIPADAVSADENDVEPQVPTLNDHPADGVVESASSEGSADESATAAAADGATLADADPEPELPLEGPEHDVEQGAAGEQGPAGEQAPAGEQGRSAGGMRIPEAAIHGAGSVVATKGGKTVEQVVAMALDGDQASVEWLSWAKFRMDPEEEKAQALNLYASARASELWANLPEPA